MTVIESNIDKKSIVADCSEKIAGGKKPQILFLHRR